MKKLILLITFTGIFFTSCKKERVCVCTGIPTSTLFSLPDNAEKNYKTITKKKAKKRCEDYAEELNASRVDSYDCQLK